ncbi:MAG: hypothetical protein ACQEP9_03155 [Bacillota bacterium]
MKKLLILSLVCLLAVGLFVGCANDQSATTEEEPEEETDVVTAASIVEDEAVFKKAIAEDGKWIIATLNDLSFNEELVVEGKFYDKGDENNDVYRKLAPYAQDDEHNVTERYTIKAPKLTIKSPNTKLQGGKFVGEVYVEANGFTLEDAEVDGNLYFANEEYAASSDLTKGAKVTGVTEVEGEADVVSAASIVEDEAVFKKAIAEDGKWIIATLNDLEFDEELVVEGKFYDKGDENNDVYRKLAPYEQDDSYNVTERYTITAPKMTIKSPNTKLQGGKFVGDIYVEANGFTLEDAEVDGNLYFAAEEYKSSAELSDKATVTGDTEIE